MKVLQFLFLCMLSLTGTLYCMQKPDLTSLRLLLAAREGNIEFIKDMIRDKPKGNFDPQDAEGKTPLLKASCR